MREEDRVGVQGIRAREEACNGGTLVVFHHH